MISNNISLAWKNLKYEVDKKLILQDLNGSFEYHTLNGLMGPSGAGKTTFINTFMRDLKLNSSSELYMNCDDSPTIAFVQQHVHETIFSKMKVGDILAYAFRFKNGWLTTKMKEKHIKTIIDELMLDVKVLERKFENCSGGEQKRIAIAQELMSLKQPTFLFIDEPTTGLDSNSAFLVMKCLKELVQQHRMTIIVSIHLPNSDILNLFNKLYILARGGVCIYSGTPKFLKQNLENQIQIEMSDEKPIIEDYLRLACKGTRNQQVDKLLRHTVQQETLNLEPHLGNLKKFSGSLKQWKMFHWFSFVSQMKRLTNLKFWWDLPTFGILIFLNIFYVILVDTIYGANISKPSGCQKILNNNPNQTCFQLSDPDNSPDPWLMHQFMIGIFLSSFSMLVTANVFLSLLKVFKNEHLNGWYSMSVFYWSFNAIHLIESVIYSALLVSLVYFTTDMLYVDNYRFNPIRFGYLLFFSWLLFVFMQSWGELLAIVFKNAILTAIISQLLITIFICSGTLLVLVEFINNYWVTLVSNLFGIRYLFKGVIYAMYGLSRCDPKTEYSFVLRKFYVDVENIFPNLFQICINILLLKVITFIVMFLQFESNLSIRNLFWFKNLSTSNVEKDLDKDEKLELYQENFLKKKMENEIEFEKFTKNKIHVAWKSLSLFDSDSFFENRSVDDKHSNLILRDLNGQLEFGTLNALMGTSGSGKTSLLKVLNGQLKNRLSEESNLYLSKYTPTRTCFLTQEVSSHLMPGLTAKQSLIYASKLKNINEIDPIDHQRNALNLLAELEIENTAETMVQRCSGGERKRLALALELTAVRMPNLICIDEPTSGLDSNSAEVVIACLSKVVHRHNITIVTSIHQPNAQVLMMFDTLHMLARGGVCIFSGPLNQIRNFLPKVSNVQFPKDSFPVEELIKYSCLDHRQALVRSFSLENDKQTYQEKKILEDTVCISDGIPTNRPRFSLKSMYFLLMRQLVCIRQHSWILLLITFLLYSLHAFFLRFIYPSSVVHESGCVNLEDDFNSTCFNDNAMTKHLNLYHSTTYLVVSNLVIIGIAGIHFGYLFMVEVVFYFNENRNGWYSTGAFYLTKLFFELLLLIPAVLSFVFIIDIYESFKPGFFWISFFVLLMATMIFQGISHMIVLVSKSNVLISSVLLFFTFYFQQMLGNVSQPIEQMHYFYQIISNLSTLRFVNEAMTLYLYGFERCPTKQISMILYQMNIHHDQYFYHCIRMLVFQVLFYRITAFLLLIFYSNNGNQIKSRKTKMMSYKTNYLSTPTNTLIPGLNSTDFEFRIKQIQV